MEIKVQKLNDNDINKFIDLIKLFEEVFETTHPKMPDQNYLSGLLKNEGFFVFVVIKDNKVIGGLTSYIMSQYYSISPLAYIYDLAVKTEFQRQGIGKLLIEATTNYCKKIGIETLMVEAEEEDMHAVEFYRSTGAKGLKVVHFDYAL